MALKPDREVYVTDIHNIAPSAVEAGQFVVYGTQPSGRGIGNGFNENAAFVVPVTGNPASGVRVAGLALTNVENIYYYALAADGSPPSGLTAGIGDPILNRVHRNFQKTTQVVGENLAVLKIGTVYTNQYNGTPAMGDTVYLGANSKASNAPVNGSLALGKFDTAPNNGYVKISINIP